MVALWKHRIPTINYATVNPFKYNNWSDTAFSDGIEKTRTADPNVRVRIGS